MAKGGKHKKMQTESPKISQDTDETPTTKTLESKAWQMSEELFMKLMMSVEAVSVKIEAIQTEVTIVKKTQMEIKESLVSLEKKVENLDMSVENVRESPVYEEISENLRKIKTKAYALDQASLNDRLIMRNLPAEITKDKSMMNAVVKKIFASLDVEINDTQFEAFATKAKDEKSANIVMKLSSEMLKSEVVRKFRKVKKEGVSLLVNKVANISKNHHLNGKQVMIANKLSSYNFQLMQTARKHVPSHFDFVFDTPESSIMVKIGNNFYQIENEEDIECLIENIEKKKAESEALKKLSEVIRNGFSGINQKLSEALKTIES